MTMKRHKEVGAANETGSFARLHQAAILEAAAAAQHPSHCLLNPLEVYRQLMLTQ